MPLGSTRVNDWVKGELASFVDLNAENETMFNFASAFAGFLLGKQSVNATPSDIYHVPLQCHCLPPFQVQIGGPNQLCVLAGRLVDEIPSTVVTVAQNNATAVRSDVIVALFVENDVAPFTRTVRQPDTTTIPTTVYQQQQSMSFQVVTGLGGQNQYGYAPAGSVAVAQIDVPANGAPLVDGDAYIILPTFGTILAGLSVSALNALVGDVVLQCPDDSITITPNTATGIILLQAAAAAAAVGSLNGLQGNVTLESTDGSLVFTNRGQFIDIVQRAVAAVFASLNGLTGAVTIDSPDGSIGVVKRGQYIDLSAKQAPIVLTGATALVHGVTAVGMSVPPGNWTFEVMWVAPGANLETQVTFASGASWHQTGRVDGEASDYNGQLQASTCVAMVAGTASVSGESTYIFNFDAHVQNSTQPSSYLGSVYTIRATPI
jgi:hypothetical protein